MKSIYIAHPFGGEQENVEKVENIIKRLATQAPRLHVLQPTTRDRVLLQPAYLLGWHGTLF